MDTSPTPDPIARKVEHLQATVEALESRVNQLEAQRRELLVENRKLRREATLVRLYEDLGTRVTTEEDTTIPQSARELYRDLPLAFTFPQFFEHADQHGMSTEEARGCLRFLLKQKQLVQTGSRLSKQDDLPNRSQASPGANVELPESPPSSRSRPRSVRSPEARPS